MLGLALQVLVEKMGLPETPKPGKDKPELACTQANDYWSKSYPRNAILEFSRDRKSMSTLCGHHPAKVAGRTTRATAGSGTNMLYVKGAPESVLERCTHARLASGETVRLTVAERKRILEFNASMAARPLRCLAMAIGEDVGDLSDYDGPHHAAHKKLIDPTHFAELEKVVTGPFCTTLFSSSALQKCMIRSRCDAPSSAAHVISFLRVLIEYSSRRPGPCFRWHLRHQRSRASRSASCHRRLQDCGHPCHHDNG